MSILNILTKLPQNIKGRVSKPVKLRINNDQPGFYIPEEYKYVLLDIIEKSKSDDTSLNDIKEILE